MPHNADQVIGDIEDVKKDLHRNMKTAGRASMRQVQRDAVAYIEADADYTGDLRRSMSMSVDDRGSTISISVHTEKAIAPYAPFVEFGTGARTMRTLGMSVPQPPPDAGTMLPPDFPYDAPGMSAGLVAAIKDWVEKKPVDAHTVSQEQLPFAIAAAIAELGNYAHPFLRPAWFDNELLVRNAMRSAVRRSFK